MESAIGSGHRAALEVFSPQIAALRRAFAHNTTFG
jgi:hypothetical protein